MFELGFVEGGGHWYGERLSVLSELGVRGGVVGRYSSIFLNWLVWWGGDLSVLPFKEIDVQYVCSHDIFV